MRAPSPSALQAAFQELTQPLRTTVELLYPIVPIAPARRPLKGLFKIQLQLFHRSHLKKRPSTVEQRLKSTPQKYVASPSLMVTAEYASVSRSKTCSRPASKVSRGVCLGLLSWTRSSIGQKTCSTAHQWKTEGPLLWTFSGIGTSRKTTAYPVG